MTDLPDVIPYERWVAHVFDHPVEETHWCSHVGDEFFQVWDEYANPPRTLEYLTCLFRSPEFLIGKYSHAQIDQGLHFIVDNSFSDHMFAIRNESLPWNDRAACILAMSTLYSDLMAPVYGDHLGHLQQGDEGPERTNSACYMWWDVIPLYGSLEHPDIDRMNDAVLQVFRETLRLRSEACLESVLHGCGHWHMDLPDRIEAIVRNFLQSRQDISPALREYAEAAAYGAVQ